MRTHYRLTLFSFSFIAILIIAVVFRFFLLGKIPYSLYWDEMAMVVDIKSVLETGKDMFGRPWFQIVYPSYGDFKLPVYIWLATLSSKIFGLSEFAFRLPSALAGIGTVVIAGLIARDLGVTSSEKPKGAKKLIFSQTQLFQLATMFVVTVSPWAILFSRTGFEGHVGQFLVALSLWLSITAFQSKEKKWLLLLAAVIGGAATYAYFSVRFVWPVVFIALQVLLHGPRIWTKFSRKNLIQFGVFQLIVPLLIFGVVLLPMFRSPLYKDTNRFRLSTISVLNMSDYATTSNVYREMAGNSTIDRLLFNQKVLMVRELLKNYSDHLSLNFMFISGDPNLRHGTGMHGLFLLPFLPLFIIGGVFFFQRHKRVLALLVIWWLAALLPASVPENTPHALRSLNALVPLSLLIGYGLFQVLRFIHMQQRRLVSLIFGVVLAIALLFSIAEFAYTYFVIYPKHSADDWQNGYKQLAQQIYEERKDNDEVWVVPFDDRFYLWLMAYGPYEAKEFQTWKSTDYKYDQFDNISVKGIKGEKLQELQGRILYVGPPQQIQEEMTRFKEEYTDKKEIYGDDGKVKFWMVRL